MRRSVYMMEAGFLSRLRADRLELLALARSLGTADEMRQAREDLMRSTRINLAPESGRESGPLYTIDSEGVAHIPMIGELTLAAEQDVCGAYTAGALTEYGFLRAAISMADEDPAVKVIALDANTPGGHADGVDEVAQVFAAAKKPTMALVHDEMQSAGYYIGSQADRIVALSPMSKFGSVGTVIELRDNTRQLEAAGIDRYVYTATESPAKRPDPNTEEGEAQFRAYADGLQAVFVSRVAQGRHTTVEDVREHYGRGATVFAADALKAGMVDEIRGLDISRKTGGVAPAAAAGAANITDKGAHMTLEELKAKEPDLYAAALKVGREEVAGELVTVKGERDTLLGKAASLEKALELSGADLAEARAQEFGRRKTVALESALKEGRIKPVDKDFWAGRLDKDLAGTEEILAKLPANPLFQTLGSGDGPGEGELKSPEEQAFRARMGLDKKEDR